MSRNPHVTTCSCNNTRDKHNSTVRPRDTQRHADEEDTRARPTSRRAAACRGRCATRTGGNTDAMGACGRRRSPGQHREAVPVGDTAARSHTEHRTPNRDSLRSKKHISTRHTHQTTAHTLHKRRRSTVHAHIEPRTLCGTKWETQTQSESAYSCWPHEQHENRRAVSGLSSEYLSGSYLVAWYLVNCLYSMRSTGMWEVF